MNFNSNIEAFLEKMENLFPKNIFQDVFEEEELRDYFSFRINSAKATLSEVEGELNEANISFKKCNEIPYAYIVDVDDKRRLLELPLEKKGKDIRTKHL